MKFSACIEWLFADEAPVFADRIRAAKDAGLDGVEFWRWTNKDLDADRGRAQRDRPAARRHRRRADDPADRSCPPRRVPRRPRNSIATARRLGAPVLIAQTGNLLETPRADQRRALVDCLAPRRRPARRHRRRPRDRAAQHPRRPRRLLPLLDRRRARHRRRGRPPGDPHRLRHLPRRGDGRGDRSGPRRPARPRRPCPPRRPPRPRRARQRQPRLAGPPGLAEQAGWDGFVGLEYRPSRATRETLAFRDALAA